MTAIQVKITDTADDGFEGSEGISTGVVKAGKSAGATLTAFFRFLNVTVPQGATIDSATLTLNITDDSSPDTTLYGVKVADAAAFADPGNLPSNATRTTASADPDPAGTGTKVITITSIVQELVDQALWSSGNAMAFVAEGNSGFFASWTAEDYEDAGTAEATLDITYTAGATIKPFRRSLLGVGF